MSLSGALTLDPLVDLPQLRTLSFKNNSFGGPIPDLAKLGPLKMLYLSWNCFSGPIADQLFDKMRSLRKVHLSHNAFSGSIPASVAGLPKLLELRLDDNAFEGAIPDLEQTGLNFVNLSQNHLEGPIPKGLSRFNANLFEGNKNLCGPPLDVPCNITQSQSPQSPGKKKISPALLVVIIVIGVLVLLSIIGLFMFILGDCRDGRIKIIGGDNIEGLLISPKKARFKHMEFLHNKGYLVAISSDNEIQVWNLEFGQLFYSLPWEVNITAFAVVQGTCLMYLGDENGLFSVLKFDVDDG